MSKNNNQAVKGDKSRSCDGKKYRENWDLKYQPFAFTPELCQVIPGNRKRLNDSIRINDKIVLKIIVNLHRRLGMRNTLLFKNK